MTPKQTEIIEALRAGPLSCYVRKPNGRIVRRFPRQSIRGLIEAGEIVVDRNGTEDVYTLPTPDPTPAVAVVNVQIALTNAQMAKILRTDAAALRIEAARRIVSGDELWKAYEGHARRLEALVQALEHRLDLARILQLSADELPELPDEHLALAVEIAQLVRGTPMKAIDPFYFMADAVARLVSEERRRRRARPPRKGSRG